MRRLERVVGTGVAKGALVIEGMRDWMDEEKRLWVVARSGSEVEGEGVCGGGEKEDLMERSREKTKDWKGKGGGRMSGG